MTRDDAIRLALEIGQDRNHEWTAHFQWESHGVYHVDAVHKPTQKRHFFHHRDEWLALQNHQAPRRKPRVKA